MQDMQQDRLAFDRAALPSARTYDEDGHLHVKDVPISKANVCPYYGREIPKFEQLGLEPNRIYNLLRHPDELAKAAGTFNGKPLLDLHRAQTAQDHARAVTVGSIHNVRFEAPYLLAQDFHVWAGESIADIDANKKRQLSSSYRYDADMTPGVFEGVAHDGVMRNIRGNHTAFVSAGRAGSDVLVNDAAIIPFNQEITMAQAKTASRQALLATGALHVYLRPKLAADAKIDLAPVVAGVTGANWATERGNIKGRLATATAGKLAQDATLEDVTAMLDHLDKVEDDEPAKPGDKVISAADAAIATQAAVTAALAEAAAKAPETVSRVAMDAAIATAATAAAQAAETATIGRLRAISEAERDVRPRVGEIAAMDSAGDVYKFALDHAGVDLTGVSPDSYRALYRAIPAPEARRVAPVAVAMDAAAKSGRATRFGDAANRLK